MLRGAYPGRLDALLSDCSELQACRVPRIFAPGDHLLRQGEDGRDLFLVRAGLVKLFYLTRDGKEWVKGFVVDRGMVASRTAQAGGESSFSAVCLEAVDAIAVPYAAFRAVLTKNPALAEAVFEFQEALGLKKEEREYDLLCRSPEERYTRFIAREPELAARLTQADIARYLGVTAIALSRIKKRALRPALQARA
jgi:CRP-like cAMP-binding protein